MTRACPCSASNLFSNLANNLFVMQKRVVTLPLKPNQDAQATLVSNFQKPARRGGVGSNGIHAVCRHQREISFNHCRRRKRGAVYARPKCSIGDTPNIEFLLAGPEKFTS